jgi:hypothetical protein
MFYKQIVCQLPKFFKNSRLGVGHRLVSNADVKNPDAYRGLNQAYARVIARNRLR